MIGLQLGTEMNMKLDKFHACLETGLTCHSWLQQECSIPQTEGVTIPVSMTTSLPPHLASYSSAYS